MADRDSSPPTKGDARRWLASSVAVLVLVAAAAIAVFLTNGDEEPAPVRRVDVVAELLGWIPATDETRRAFSVWSEDLGAGAGTPAPNSALDPLIDQLALTPMPLTLGRSSGWRDHFGYGARDVTRWATAGAGSSIAILGGTFDRAVIERALMGNGYRRTTYQGVLLFIHDDVATPSRIVDGDAVSAANAIALYADRLITSRSPDVVRGAIDAAQGRFSSLADDPQIAAMLRTLAPLNGIVVVDAADHAIACGLGEGWQVADLQEPSDRYVAVGYGRLGANGQRRTMVVTSFAESSVAEAESIAYEAGWRDGVVYAGGAGAAISAFGRVNVASRSSNFLVAELVEGKDAGWVRAGIRFAEPACQAATMALPPGTPVAPPVSEQSSGVNRVFDALGDVGTDGMMLVADLAAIADARAVSPPPEQHLDVEATRQWLNDLAPLPTFTAFPQDADALARWPMTFGIPLGSIMAVGELRPGEDRDAIAVLIGTWDRRTVENALSGLGYVSVRLDRATIFAFSGDPEDAADPVNQIGGQIWHNVGVIDGHIFLSSSSQSLRETVRAAIGTASFPTPSGDAGFRDRLLATAPTISAAAIVGARAAVRSCVSGSISANLPDWLGLAAIWSVGSSAAGDTAAIAVFPDAAASLTAIGAELDDRVQDGRLPVGDGSTEEVPLAQALGYSGVQRHDLVNQRPVAVARFVIPTPATGAADFFAATVEDCSFVPLT